jgi:hypothetical protein
MRPLRQRIETDRSNIIMAAKRPDVRAEWGREDSNLPANRTTWAEVTSATARGWAARLGL